MLSNGDLLALRSRRYNIGSASRQQQRPAPAHLTPVAPPPHLPVIKARPPPKQSSSTSGSSSSPTATPPKHWASATSPTKPKSPAQQDASPRVASFSRDRLPSLSDAPPPPPLGLSSPAKAYSANADRRPHTSTSQRSPVPYARSRHALSPSPPLSLAPVRPSTPGAAQASFDSVLRVPVKMVAVCVTDSALVLHIPANVLCISHTVAHILSSSGAFREGLSGMLHFPSISGPALLHILSFLLWRHRILQGDDRDLHAGWTVSRELAAAVLMAALYLDLADLVDVCIRKFSKYIYDVELFGDLPRAVLRAIFSALDVPKLAYAERLLQAEQPDFDTRICWQELLCRLGSDSSLHTAPDPRSLDSLRLECVRAWTRRQGSAAPPSVVSDLLHSLTIGQITGGDGKRTCVYAENVGAIELLQSLFAKPLDGDVNLTVSGPSSLAHLLQLFARPASLPPSPVKTSTAAASPLFSSRVSPSKESRSPVVDHSPARRLSSIEAGTSATLPDEQRERPFMQRVAGRPHEPTSVSLVRCHLNEAFPGQLVHGSWTLQNLCLSDIASLPISHADFVALQHTITAFKHTLTSLSLAGTCLGLVNSTQLLHCLTSDLRLQELDLSAAVLPYTIARADADESEHDVEFRRALAAFLDRARHLHTLKVSNNAFSKLTLLSLAEGIGRPRAWQRLQLDGIGLGHQLASITAKWSQASIERLQELTIADNNIASCWLVSALHALAAFKPKQLRTLDVSNNQMSADMLHALGSFIGQCSATITCVSLDVSHKVLQYPFDALESLFGQLARSHLTRLSMNGCDLSGGTDDFPAVDLVAGMLLRSSSISLVRLNNCNVSQDDCARLAAAVQRVKRVLVEFPLTPLVESYTYHSPVPDSARQLPCILGVDEAGRGPVLGPMVYSCCYIPRQDQQQLSDIGVNDSKQLSEESRDRMFRLLKEASRSVGYSIRSLSPQDISQWMLRRSKYNLNAMAHDATIELIRQVLLAGVRVDEIYVDTVGPPQSYQAKLKATFPQVGTIVVAKKADSLYPVVSAASICAKVTRDHLLTQWQFTEAVSPDRNWGSGYPGDPNTSAWLGANVDHVFGFPGIARFSWSTCALMLDQRAAAVTWPDEEQDQDQLKITSTFGAATQDKARQSQLRSQLKLCSISSW
ncbi:hypothetical protein RI367_000031 [Sorochytrium milnesiophthora]